jgi:hypothetical protein
VIVTVGTDDKEMLSSTVSEEAMVMDLPMAVDRLGIVIRRYMDMGKDDAMKWTYWVLGAALHNHFPTFPYLYLNAMRGSGKSRLLKLTAFLLGGLYTTTPTEATLFRTRDPLMIDEAETISKKERAALREVMNAAYKNGLRIRRIRKVERTGDYVADEFDVYRPMMFANIDGMDDVLEDRCLKIILEKSNDVNITRRLELFELDHDCATIRSFLRLIAMGSVGSVVSDAIKNILQLLFNVFNDCIIVTKPTLTDTTTLPTLTDTTDTTVIMKVGELSKRLLSSKLIGRDFELWMPLMVMGSLAEKDVDVLILIAETEASARLKNSGMENRDMTFISFLADWVKNGYKNEWVSGSELVGKYMLDNPDDKWFNSEWVGRAMVRNMLASNRRRLSRGREYVLNSERITAKALSLGLMEEVKKDTGEQAVL